MTRTSFDPVCCLHFAKSSPRLQSLYMGILSLWWPYATHNVHNLRHVGNKVTKTYRPSWFSFHQTYIFIFRLLHIQLSFFLSFLYLFNDELSHLLSLCASPVFSFLPSSLYRASCNTSFSLLTPVIIRQNLFLLSILFSPLLLYHSFLSLTMLQLIPRIIFSPFLPFHLLAGHVFMLSTSRLWTGGADSLLWTRVP
jgi:hypothetical protein